MFGYEECRSRWLTKLGKPFEKLSTFEKALLADITNDSCRGRYPKLLMWSAVKRDAFFKWLKEQNIEYSELSDPERWAYEDAFHEDWSKED